MAKVKLEEQRNKLYELTLGYVCNCNCRFCSIHPERRRVDKTTAEAMVDIYQAKKQHFNLLGFGGGEPTIRRDIINLTKFANDLKFHTIRIQTNGVRLSDKDFCKRLVEAGANFFKVSIHGHRAEIQDYLTRLPGSFNLVLKGIENLKNLGIRIEANIVVNKINYKFLPQYIDFFANKGISSFCIIFPMYTGNMALNYKEVGITIKEASPYIHEALDLIDSLGLDKGLTFNVPYCYMQGYEKQVVERYNMKLITPDLVINDADSNIKSGKKKLAECKRCRYKHKCSGIWDYYLRIYGESEFKNFNK